MTLGDAIQSRKTGAMTEAEWLDYAHAWQQANGAKVGTKVCHCPSCEAIEWDLTKDDR